VKFKIDENMPVEVAELLRDHGHDAMTVYEQGLAGGSDRRILDVCDAEERILMTLDIDFADIRTYPPQDHFGLIVFRLDRQDKPHVLSAVQKTLAIFAREKVVHTLWLVDENRVRIRGEN